MTEMTDKPVNHATNEAEARPLPAFAVVARDDASAPFFYAACEGRFVLRSCLSCKQLRAPEIPMCTKCLNESFSWVDAVGTGEIVSWVVLHPKPVAGKVAPMPRVMVTVELTEGPWVLGALLGVESSSIQVGRTVTIDFERPEGSEPIPVFR